MWCREKHPKVTPYVVVKNQRHISLYHHLKQWIKKFSLSQDCQNQIRSFVKNLREILSESQSFEIALKPDAHILNSPLSLTEMIEKQNLTFDETEFKFISPQQMDIIGSFLSHSICVDPTTKHAQSFNVDIAVTIPKECVNASHLTDGSYLLRRSLYLHCIADYLRTKCELPMITHTDRRCPITVDYFNGDSNKPILLIKPLSFCAIRIIPCLDIENFTDESISKNDILDRIFFESDYEQWSILVNKYSVDDISQWSLPTLISHLNTDDNKQSSSTKSHFMAQQILEDLHLKQHFLDFYEADKENPNLHRALILIKSWWKSCNNGSNNMRFCAVNNFHITMYLLQMHRSYHIDKWDSPLIIMAKFLELISREELGTFLVHKPMCTLFDEHNFDSSYPTTFADSHLFQPSNESHIDRESVFTQGKRKSKADNSDKQNANLYNDPNATSHSDAVSIFHYSFSIWKQQLKKGLIMSFPLTGPQSFDSWSSTNEYNDIYIKLLTPHFPILFCDLNARLNFCFRVSVSNYLHFIQQARRASDSINTLLEELPLMENPDSWGYHTPMNPVQFDLVSPTLINFHEKCLSELLGITQIEMDFWHSYDAFIRIVSMNDVDVAWFHRLERVLMEALRDRCRGLRIQFQPQSSHIVIGLHLYPFPFRSMILGPPKDSGSVEEEFRQFWGDDMVAVRRFEGIATLNTVALNQTRSNAKAKAKKPSQSITTIVNHILQKHLRVDCSKVLLILDPFVSVTPKCLLHCSRLGQKTSDESLKKAFGRLESTLYSLSNNKDMPLRVLDVSGTHSALWDADIFPPKSSNINYLSYSAYDNLEPISVVIRFESSASWPKQSLKALQSLKVAFYIQISKHLQRLNILSYVSKTHIDVIVNGYCFQCKIVADSEFSVDHFKAQSTVRYELNFLPKFGKLIRGISSNYMAFAPTMSVVKRWFHSNLFSDALSEELLTILVADLFVSPEPFSPPQSELQGLLRFLNVIATFNWIENPYVAHVGSQFGLQPVSKFLQNVPIAKQFQIFRARMMNERMSDKGLHAMYVVVPGLDEQSKWTRETPTLQTLDRLVTFGKASLQHLRRCMQSSAADSAYLSIFKPPLQTQFDFLIHLHSALVRRYQSTTFRRSKDTRNQRKSQLRERLAKLSADTQSIDANNDSNDATETKVDTESKSVVTIIDSSSRKRKLSDTDFRDANSNKKQRLLGGKGIIKSLEEGTLDCDTYLRQSQMHVVGLDCVRQFINDVNRCLDRYVSLSFDANGGTIIGGQWLSAPNANEKKGLETSVFTALTELGRGLVCSIEVTKRDATGMKPLSTKYAKLAEAISQSRSNKEDDNEEWVTV